MSQGRGVRRKMKFLDKQGKEAEAIAKPNRTAEEAGRTAKYSMTLLKLKEECVKNFREKLGKAEVKLCDKKIIDSIFKELSIEEFKEMLQATTGKPDIEVTSKVFKLRKAYPVDEKEELRKYLLEEGRDGITDDDNFELCYRDIRKDIGELIKEGWVRVVDNYEGHKKVESNKQRIFFPRDISSAKKNTPDQVEWDEEELPQNC